MRIAYLSSTYPPMISGVSDMLQRLSVGMSERGHSVLVIAASDKEEAYTVQIRNLTLVRLRSYRNPIATGVRFMLWPKKSVTDHLRIFSPDILHLHDLLHVSLAGLLSGRSLRLPILYTVHQLPWVVSAYIGASGSLKRTVENSLWAYGRWFVGQCTVVISPTATVANHVLEKTNSRPHVISNGVDTLFFTPWTSNSREQTYLQKKYNLTPDVPIILHVGRISTEKKVHTVIQAAARVMQIVNALLLIVGDGPELKAMKRLARELGIHDRVYFPGLVPHDGDLPGLYRIASVFLTASEIETQGLVVLEAMASGLPVVASRASSIPELVNDGISGYLVASGKIGAMADRLLFLLKNPGQARDMGRAARAIAEKHSTENTIDAHERLYQSVLENITSRAN